MSTTSTSSSSSSTGTSSLYSSSSRITSMYSNLDTDSLVKAACSTEQTKLDKAKQKETSLQWKDSAISTINTDVDTFVNKYLVNDGASSITKSDAYYSYSVSNLTDSTNKSVTLEANGATAYTGNITVGVSQLAKNATATNSTSTTLKGAAVSSLASGLTRKLSTLSGLSFDTSGQTTMTIEGTTTATLTFHSTDTISSMISQVNSSGTGVTMSYNSNTEAFTLTGTNVAASGDLATALALTTAKGATQSTSGTTSTLTGATVSALKPADASAQLNTISSLSFTNGSTSMTINGTSFSFNSTDSIATVLNKVNSSSVGATMAYSASKQTFTLTSTTSGSTGTVTTTGDLATALNLTTANGATLTAGTNSSGVSASGSTISSTSKLGDLGFANSLFGNNDKISFTINGASFSFDKTTTLQSMLNTINNSSTAGVTMSYSRLTDSFTIAADSGGEGSSVKITNTLGNAFGTKSAFGINTGSYSNGQNSIATIARSGTSTTLNTTSNELSDYDGITYTLNKVTSADQEYNVTRDYSATTKSIQTFVDGFNDLLTELNNAVDFDTDTDVDPDDYLPLTDSQKENMSDTEITKWETYGKDHLLRSDSDITTLIRNLKDSFFTALAGTGLKASDLGITTGTYGSTDSGKLVLDTKTLKTALENDGSNVVNFFTSTTTGSRGLAYTVSDTLKAYEKTAKTTVTNNTEKITSLKKDVTSLTTKLTDKTNRYYAKYAKMETALSTLQSQSTALSSLTSSSS